MKQSASGGLVYNSLRIMESREKNLKIEKSRIIRSIKECLIPKPEILLAYIYGSFYQNEANWGDIDIALFIAKGSVENTLEYILKVSNELTRYLKIEADIRILNEAPLYFQYEVINTGMPILIRDEAFRVSYEAELMSKWLDFKVLVKEYDKALLQRIESW